MNSKKCHSKFMMQNIIISNAKVIKKKINQQQMATVKGVMLNTFAVPDLIAGLFLLSMFSDDLTLFPM